MKKLFVFILSVMMILSMVACGNGGTNVVAPTTEEATLPTEFTFTDVIVVDNDECTITITAIDPDNTFGYTLAAQLENKSADKTYMFAVDDVAINGVECTALFATEVTPGKKANSDITFTVADRIVDAIGEYTDIELSFRVYDMNDLEAAYVVEETVHIYPFGEDKATTFVREAMPTDTVILDNEYVTATVIGYEENELWGYSVNLFLVNKTDTPVMFSTNAVSVNDVMLNPVYAESVAPGNCAFSYMTWFDTEFEKNDITAVESIEFVLRAYDENDLTAADFANEAVKLVP
jgi:hypothetical protein